MAAIVTTNHLGTDARSQLVIVFDDIPDANVVQAVRNRCDSHGDAEQSRHGGKFKLTMWGSPSGVERRVRMALVALHRVGYQRLDGFDDSLFGYDRHVELPFG